MSYYAYIMQTCILYICEFPRCLYNRKRNTYPIMVCVIYYIIILYMSVMCLMNGRRKKCSVSLSDQMERLGTEILSIYRSKHNTNDFWQRFTTSMLTLIRIRDVLCPEKDSYLYHVMCVLL